MEKKYEQSLIQQANLQKTFYDYSKGQIQPCVYFWKQLVKFKQAPSILVPDTLILNDKQNPLIWIYTNSRGKLQKSTDINYKDFVAKITNYCSPNQLSATLKKVTYNDNNYINGNDIKLLNSRYLQNSSIQQIGGQSQTMITLQRYIKSNGNKAFICRTIYRAGQKGSECFIITNKKSYYDEEQPQNKRFLVKCSPSTHHSPSSCTIIKSIQGKHLTETSKSLKEITDYMKFYRGIVLSEIVGDFVKDQSGNWWLINIKAFQIQQKITKNPTLQKGKLYNNSLQQAQISSNLKLGGYEDASYQKQKYQKTSNCRYCEKSYLQSQLTHKMTIKMLIETDRYLLHLGKSYNWLRRSDIQNVDSHCLYEMHKICERCYRLYMEIQELMEVEDMFLKKLGFQMQQKPKEILMSLTNQQALKNESKDKEIASLGMRFNHKQDDNIIGNENMNSFPKTIELGPNSNITFEDDVPIKNDQNINKMIRYRMVLYLKEIDQIKFPQSFGGNFKEFNYYLEYELFGIKNRLKLDMNNNYDEHKQVLKIKKLKINYFFSHSHDQVYDYLKNYGEDFVIRLIIQEKSHFSKTPAFLKTNNSLYETETGNGLSKSGKGLRQSLKNHHYQIQQDQGEDNENSENQKQKRFGVLRLPIKDIFNNLRNPNNKISKKDFYKFFSFDKFPHGWGLQGSIGIIPSQTFVNTSRMIFFTQDSLIYLPNDNYYYCEHLPEEWIDLIKNQIPNQLTSTVRDDRNSNPRTISEFASQSRLDVKKPDHNNTTIDNTLDLTLQTDPLRRIDNTLIKQKDEISELSKQSVRIGLKKKSLQSQIGSKVSFPQTNISQDWKKSLLKQQIFSYDNRKLKTQIKQKQQNIRRRHA